MPAQDAESMGEVQPAAGLRIEERLIGDPGPPLEEGLLGHQHVAFSERRVGLLAGEDALVVDLDLGGFASAPLRLIRIVRAARSVRPPARAIAESSGDPFAALEGDRARSCELAQAIDRDLGRGGTLTRSLAKSGRFARGSAFTIRSVTLTET